MAYRNIWTEFSQQIWLTVFHPWRGGEEQQCSNKHQQHLIIISNNTIAQSIDLLDLTFILKQSHTNISAFLIRSHPIPQCRSSPFLDFSALKTDPPPDFEQIS